MNWYLENDDMRLTIGCMPEDNQRFEHFGHVVQAEDKRSKNTYLGQESLPSPPENAGYGICQEFCASAPIGFAEAEIGDWFLKPGVGILQKNGAAYHFTERYKHIPLKAVPTVLGDDELVFDGMQDNINGRSYRYTKRFLLKGRELTIICRMENCGKKELYMQEYAHNFFQPNGGNAERLLLCWDGDLPFHTDGYSYIVRNQEGTWGIREQGDFPPLKFKVWVDRECFCPEVFAEIRLQTGESFEWKRNYTFFTKI